MAGAGDAENLSVEDLGKRLFENIERMCMVKGTVDLPVGAAVDFVHLRDFAYG